VHKNERNFLLDYDMQIIVRIKIERGLGQNRFDVIYPFLEEMICIFLRD
jgi:hypothetical protein